MWISFLIAVSIPLPFILKPIHGVAECRLLNTGWKFQWQDLWKPEEWQSCLHWDTLPLSGLTGPSCLWVLSCFKAKTKKLTSRQRPITNYKRRWACSCRGTYTHTITLRITYWVWTSSFLPLGIFLQCRLHSEHRLLFSHFSVLCLFKA